MAVVMRQRRFVNPGRKRRLSLKQKLHFGSKRQRTSAALRLSGKRKRRNGVVSRFYGHVTRKPGRKRMLSKVHTGPRKRRKNVGHILSFTLNPGQIRRKKVMARRRRTIKVVAHRQRRANRGFIRRQRKNLFGFGTKRRRSYRRRHNPVSRVTRRVKHHRIGARRHNPSFGNIGGMVVQAAWTIAGLVGTRAVTQMVLGASNTGIMGYAANGVAAILLGTLTGKFLKNPKAGQDVTLGGFVGIVLRAVQEYTPVGAYIKSQLNGLGDYSLGIYLPTTFFVPLNASDNRNGNNMSLPGAVSALAMVPKKGMAGLGSRYGSGSRYA